MVSRDRRYWENLTTDDFRALDPARLIALLPVAATEQHGPHLPLSTDRRIVEGVLGRALDLLPPEVPLAVLPTQAVGLSTEHEAFAGTLSGSVETLLNLWSGIGAGVARAGVRKLIVLNSHGGNSNLVGLLIQTLRSSHDMLAVAHHCYRIWRESPLFSEAERRDGIHGGAIETSIMMALDPDCVRTDAIRSFQSTASTVAAEHAALVPGGRTAFAWEMQDLNPCGAVGDPRDADADRGRVLIDDAARQLVEVLIELDRLDPAVILVDHGS
jgi:creatinine amidohydrolase